MNVDEIRSLAADVVRLLANRDYRRLSEISAGRNLSADQIEWSVATYGRTLVPLPASGIELIDIVDVDNSDPPRALVIIPLWTAEEGRSDLTLEMVVLDRNRHLDIELADIHVL